jgi:hypothetical protein
VEDESTYTHSTTPSVCTFYSCKSADIGKDGDGDGDKDKDKDSEIEKEKEKGKEKEKEKEEKERQKERERVKRNSNDSYCDLSRLENARSTDNNDRIYNKDNKRIEQIITPRKFIQSSTSNTDLEITDLDKDSDVIFPYPVIGAILGMWFLYALLYVMLQLTNKCTWEYFLVLTM